VPQPSDDEKIINSPFVRILFLSFIFLFSFFHPFSFLQDGRVLRQWRAEGFFSNEKNLLLELSTDSIQIFKVRCTACFPPFFGHHNWSYLLLETQEIFPRCNPYLHSQSPHLLALPKG
jgi:hypothetical protein